MPKYKSLAAKVLSFNEKEFEELALDIFFYQYEHNFLYKSYVDLLKLDVKQIKDTDNIPFIPIDFFKRHDIKTSQWQVEAIYTSSGTTSSTNSKHFVRDVGFYNQLTKKIFEQTYGGLENYHILALLPSYLERKGSSLIDMIQYFISESKSVHSGFYLYNVEELISKIEFLKKDVDRKILLWGVSFALLDLVENHQVDLSGNIVMETGGMKGRRKELTRQELHSILSKSFHVKHIHSEYGMTELMSQAYSKGLGLFELPITMKVKIRDINDPFYFYSTCNKRGGINVIDLANIHSCAFIETQDLGLLHDNGMLEIIGRFDNSDIRGCNLMI